MDWAVFAVGAAGALLAANALWPLRLGWSSGASFFPSWVVSEAPVHTAAVTAVVLGVLAGLGGADGWPGVCGLALGGVAIVLLAFELASGIRAVDHVADALERAGLGRPAGRWTARDTWRVAVLVPWRERGVERLRDLAYVDDGARAHLLDVYRPRARPTTGLSPVVVYFHGGAWMIGEKREQGLPMMNHLARLGLVCVTANYALSPRATWPEHVVDCKRALHWVTEHIAELGGDPGRIVVAGGSAGGHLAALCALTPTEAAWQPGFEQADTSVAACVALYGVYDLVDDEHEGHPVLGALLEKRVFRLPRSDASYAAASPLYRVRADAPPFLVVHGRNDVVVPVATARRFARNLGEVSGAPVAYVELPLAQHAFDVFWSPRSVRLARAVEHFAARVLPAPESPSAGEPSASVEAPPTEPRR